MSVTLSRLRTIIFDKGVLPLLRGQCAEQFRGLCTMTRQANPSSLRERMVPSSEMVYVVDDDASVVDALSSLLRANGKRVQIFTSGQDFLDFERQDSCACLILDLRMPGLNGLQVQELIAAQTTIPVIFITGRGDVPSTVTR